MCIVLYLYVAPSLKFQWLPTRKSLPWRTATEALAAAGGMQPRKQSAISELLTPWNLW